MAHILILLPQIDFDPTEVAVPWKALREAGHKITFATQTGEPGFCDRVTLTGNGLPFLARSLKSKPDNAQLYSDMIATAEFQNPIAWDAVKQSDYDGFHFPGGHAPGMKPYLESKVVQRIARDAFNANKPVSAICHGVIPLARADLLKGRKTTALTAFQENFAICLTRFKLGDHYKTYPQCVEDEVRAALSNPKDFYTGPMIPNYATAVKPQIGFIVRDGNYVSARFPGDAWTLATEFCRILECQMIE